MIIIKDKAALAKMEQAGQLLALIFQDLPSRIEVGVSTLELDGWIEEQLRAKNMIGMSKGYHGYKHVSCISLNDEVVHGIPKKDRLLKAGDLVKVDVGASWSGYCADMTRCYYVDQVPQVVRDFVQTAQNSLDQAITCVQSGQHLSDLSAAVQAEVERHGYGVVRAFAGHGIGKQMHEDPEILNYGKPGKGPRLAVGMTLAIEPMITMGSYEVYVDKDGWTVKTKDGSLAAHVEDTVAVTEHGPRVFTRI